jgi:3-isopropylmalate/(R)-2-methylmalate dehydratase small subunit
MEPFRRLTGIAVSLDEPNIDTNQLCPSRFNKLPIGPGFERVLFHDRRYAADESEHADFILNRPPYRDARILVADRNFGCGSSRENAVLALLAFGIRAVIAPSFGDIFASNAAKNGLLTVVLPDAGVKAMIAALKAEPGLQIAVDLEAQTVRLPNGLAQRFEIDPYRKHLLLSGLDELGFTLSQLGRIEAFEKTYAG